MVLVSQVDVVVVRLEQHVVDEDAVIGEDEETTFADLTRCGESTFINRKRFYLKLAFLRKGGQGSKATPLLLVDITGPVRRHPRKAMKNRDFRIGDWFHNRAVGQTAVSLRGYGVNRDKAAGYGRKHTCTTLVPCNQNGPAALEEIFHPVEAHIPCNSIIIAKRDNQDTLRVVFGLALIFFPARKRFQSHLLEQRPEAVRSFAEGGARCRLGVGKRRQPKNCDQEEDKNPTKGNPIWPP